MLPLKGVVIAVGNGFVFVGMFSGGRPDGCPLPSKPGAPGGAGAGATFMGSFKSAMVILAVGSSRVWVVLDVAETLYRGYARGYLKCLPTKDDRISNYSPTEETSALLGLIVCDKILTMMVSARDDRAGIR
jgi:hypothetical protein